MSLLVPFVLGFQQCPAPGLPFDFDDDGKADISVFRPSNGTWWVYGSKTSAASSVAFGLQTDTIVPGDYTGDRRTDIAIFRSGEWFILRSEDFTYYGFPFGLPGDIPAPANYDPSTLDNRTDVAVYRPSEGMWYVTFSGFGPIPGGVRYRKFGLAEDRPVPADYDGDKSTDLAVFRPATGEWYIERTTDQQVLVIPFGLGTDKAVPADYTGDLKADIAVFRPETGYWYILKSEDFSYYMFPFGKEFDVPAPADYAGDGRTDAAVFRPEDGMWYILQTTGGLEIRSFGLKGDLPAASAYVR
jgi:hypothetical protein